MRGHLYMLVIAILGLSSCKHRNNTTDVSNSKMHLTFEVIPEDYERNLYYVEWIDTLGQLEGYQGKNLIKRPKEIWCVITNDKNDSLGYYCGRSTAQTFAAFQSKDTFVTLNFMIGLNFFTDKFENGQSIADYERAARDYSKNNRLPIVFKPIRINLKTDIRKKYNVELQMR